jgi:hypothetical protein
MQKANKLLILKWIPEMFNTIVSGIAEVLNREDIVGSDRIGKLGTRNLRE